MRFQLTGNCVVCQAHLTKEDYEKQAVVVLIGSEGTVVCCMKHVENGTANPDYEMAIRRMALAKAAQLRRSRSRKIMMGVLVGLVGE